MAGQTIPPVEDDDDLGSATELHRLALLGGLAPGIAHEVNTLLGVVVTAASHFTVLRRTLVERLEGDSLTRRDLDTYLEGAHKAERIMLTNLERAAALARSFKHVSVAQHHEDIQHLVLLGTLEDVIQSGHGLLRTLPHSLHLDCPPDMEVDTVPGALASILLNLLSNSAKHACPADVCRTDPVAITVAARICDAETWSLTYADTGCGIPAHLADRVFEPFVTTRRGAGGSGLGLSIVRTMAAEVLGGRVELTSAPGVGTTFHFIFPRTRAIAKDGGCHA